MQAARLGVLALVPLPGAELRHLVRDPPVGTRASGPSPARPPRSSSCPGSWPRRCRVSRPSACRWCRSPAPARITRLRLAAPLERRRRHLRAPHDQDLRVDPLERPGQRVGAQVGLRLHLAAELLQAVDADLLELVSDQDAHSIGVSPVGVVSSYDLDATEQPAAASFGSNHVLFGGMICAGVGHGEQLLHRRRDTSRSRRAISPLVHPPLQLRRAPDAAHEVDPLVGARIADAEDRPQHPVLQQRHVERADRIAAGRWSPGRSSAATSRPSRKNAKLPAGAAAAGRSLRSTPAQLAEPGAELPPA